MTFTARNTVINHYSLGFEVEGLWLLVLGIGLGIRGGQEFRQGPELDGKAKSMTAGVILLHRLDDLGKDVFVVAHDQV